MDVKVLKVTEQTLESTTQRFSKAMRMNELPVIGSLCLRTDFWDRHGANIATH